MTPQERARELAAVLTHFADGGEVEFRDKNADGDPTWYLLTCIPAWDFNSCDYRIKDPYAALKEAAKDPTKQIRVIGSNKWLDAGTPWTWVWPPEDYEIRDKPKTTKKVKLLAYIDDWGEMHTRTQPTTVSGWKRVPAEDKEIEVSE